jgi:DNA-binding transcriptional LysR family regulator
LVVVGGRILRAAAVRKKRLLRNPLFRDTERMNLARLEVFVAVCDAGSFTLAAERLAIAKSAASQQVATFERELGVQLLHRSTRSLTLTEAGDSLLQEGRALLAQARELAERTRGTSAQLSGVLRITSAQGTAGWVAPLIAEYLRRHPQMQVEYLATDRLADLAAEGIDLSLRTTGRRDSALRAVTLAEFEVLCAASPAYLREHGEPQRLADLATHVWIAFTPLPSPWVLRTADGRQSVRLARRVSTASTAGGRALALAGAGIFASPSFALEDDLAAGCLVRVLPKLKLPLVSLYAAWPGRLEPPAKTRAFIELAKEKLLRPRRAATPPAPAAPPGSPARPAPARRRSAPPG